MTRFHLLILILFGLTACHTPRYSADQLPPERLVFGSGGGFSGIETSHTLVNSGQLWKQQGVGAPMTEITGISSWEAKSLVNSAGDLIYGEVALNPLGNTYSFIEYISPERSSRITWTGELPTVDPALARLVNDLFHLTAKK
ncbi:MAG: hypothetical protein H6568_15900 [Lewinellaceae bacterium]|nr:hypothetical protein [Saprospiraceae bacterium]MCB9314242.1 hypothetical protein [Lewinellaceae bacterium]